MAGFNKHQQQAANNLAKRQNLREQVLGLNAHQRHKKFIDDYVNYYALVSRERQEDGQANVKKIKTDYEVLKEHYRFIRNEDNDEEDSWEARLAKKYYDRLFKEYCIADLSRYKQAKIGMRWRSHHEVVEGKGQFICGAKGCSSKIGLCSYEVNFAYQEHGEKKQALVKLRVCPGCALKLNYKQEKEFRKVQQQIMKALGVEKSAERDCSDSDVRSTQQQQQEVLLQNQSNNEDSSAQEPLLQQGQESNPQQQEVLKKVDENIWAQNQDGEQHTELDEYDKYFSEMFL